MANKYKMRLEKNNIDVFETNLGSVFLNVNLLPKFKIKKLEKLKFIETKGHQIEVITFDTIKQWLGRENSIDKSMGWILRIRKKNEIREKITIECSLVSKNKKTSSEIDVGEHLDSLHFENETDVLSIGTEDGEMMKYRSENEDWMPLRFKESLGYQSNSEFSFTNYLDTGLETKVPELIKGEKIYFHYLIATKKKKDLKKDDISTNIAVDFSKWTLIERLKIKE